MIVTFIGHSKIHYGSDVEKALLEALETNINGKDVTFYMGLDGRFDWLAKNCCIKYRKKYGNAKVIFVTPYMGQRPKRYAIAARNHYMIDNADIVVHYTCYPFGNATEFVGYASAKHKYLVDLYYLMNY